MGARKDGTIRVKLEVAEFDDAQALVGVALSTPSKQPAAGHVHKAVAPFL